MEFPALPPPDYSSRGTAVAICASVMIVVSTLAVMLRFGSRIVLPSYRFWWDDWAVLATLIFSHAFLSCAIYWTTIGLGKHVWMIDPKLALPNIYVNWATLALYATTIFLMRLSALLFYARLFKINRRFVIWLWVVGFLLVIWWVTTIIVPWSFCRPWSKNLDPTIPGECVPGTAWHHAVAFTNFFFDIVVLVLPMPVIWRLQMTFRKKAAVSFVFLLGYSSAFLSLSRFIMIEVDPSILDGGPAADMSWDLIPIMFPSFLEAPVAIIALCSPAINRLLTLVSKQHRLGSFFSSLYRRKTGAYASDYSGQLGESKRTASGKGSHLASENPLDGDNNSTTAIIRDGDDCEAVPMRPISRN